MENNRETREKLAVDKCLKHLEVIEADNKVKQLVYMYMTNLYREAYSEGYEDGHASNVKENKLAVK
ncbi:hypothetical protein [Pseudalkalibacillus caeni]|uniref:Uncharacterized protein n=1 Tax=Exobacillus caeni TaxID=2574798 RepID=A0A5R9F6R7_9BACL|nr:hypothetical protein [Pseudalkalibacillus caeni]TLS38199.1 hypothetical protein FCL54_06585 [Pseudalkalibacillus caeni]